jgi:hypothetical protein
MNLQPEDDDLDPYEAWARDCLTPFLGPLRKIDRRGGPPGLHDFEADLANGSVAALEVTGEVDKKRMDLAASAGRLSFTHPGSTLTWSVALAAGARVRAISLDELGRLLGDLEASGRRSAHGWGEVHERVRLELGEGGAQRRVVAHVQREEPGRPSEMVAEGGESLVHGRDRDGTDRAHLIHPDASQQGVGATDDRALPGEVLGQGPAEIAVDAGDEHSHRNPPVAFSAAKPARWS